jgi:hypothetical protein
VATSQDVSHLDNLRVSCPKTTSCQDICESSGQFVEALTLDCNGIHKGVFGKGVGLNTVFNVD